MARRKNGESFPIELTVSQVGSRDLFTGILRDITRRKELEREVVEIAAIEQERIAQMLHDDISQELTGLGLMATALVERAKGSPDEVRITFPAKSPPVWIASSNKLGGWPKGRSPWTSMARGSGRRWRNYSTAPGNKQAWPASSPARENCGSRTPAWQRICSTSPARRSATPSATPARDISSLAVEIRDGQLSMTIRDDAAGIPVPGSARSKGSDCG